MKNKLQKLNKSLAIFFIFALVFPVQILASEGEETQPTTPPQTEQETSQEETTVIVVTGDSVGQSDIVNEVNTTHTDIEKNTEDEQTEEVEEEVEVEVTEVFDEVDIDTSLDIDTDETASVGNFVSSTSETGDNNIEGNHGDVGLLTGNSVLVSNILNLINFNVVGTDFMTSAINVVGGIIGNLDLSRFNSNKEIAEEVESTEEFREFVNEHTDSVNSENEEKSDEDGNEVIDQTVTVDNSVNIDTELQADVVNDVSLIAKSGNNTIKKNGSVYVETGDVFLASNIANIVNTTIVGDGFTLAIINIIGSDWDGNIILPSLTKQNGVQDTNPIQTQCETCGSDADALHSEIDASVDIEVVSDANVDTKVVVEGNTGSNSIKENNGDVYVQTGDSVSVSHVLDYINTAIFGNSYVYGVVNMVGGSWGGNIWGVPAEGFVINNHGSYITFEHTPEVLKVYSDDFEDEDDDKKIKQSSLDSSATIYTGNTANISNNVVLEADTGNNEISENDGTIILDTGNSYALSNIFNMVNTSILGDNVVFAYINVIGSNWDGDINFGMPDLHLVEVATADPDPAKPGGFIDYTIVVTNKGDAQATNAQVQAQTNPNLVDVVEMGDGKIDENGLITWRVPKIGIGEIVTLYYRARIHNEAQHNDIVENDAIVTSAESDRNAEDNKAETKIVVHGTPGPNVAGFGFPVIFSNAGKTSLDQQYRSSLANPIDSGVIKLSQTNNSTGLVKPGQTVTYTISVDNTTDNSVYDVLVLDELMNPGGEIIAQQAWPLGEVLPKEHIEIDYTVHFGADINSGTYTNSIYGDGFSEDDSYLVFNSTKSLIYVEGEFDPNSVEVSLDYNYYEEKYLGYEDLEEIIVTNNGEVGIAGGMLIVHNNSAVLEFNGEQQDSFAIFVPGLQQGESYVVNLSALPKQVTDRTQVNIDFFIEEVQVASISTFHKIVDDVPLAKVALAAESDNSNNGSTKNIDNDSPIYDPVSLASEKLAYLEPKVLGYEEDFTGEKGVLNNSYINFLRKHSWLMAWFVVLVSLFLIRRKKDEEQA